MEKAGKIETKYLNNKLFENYGIWFTTKELKDFKETGQYDGDIDELFIVVKKAFKLNL